MTTTSPTFIDSSHTQASRTPILAFAAVAVSAVLSAIGTFWDPAGSDHKTGSQVGPYLGAVGIAVVAAALVFGLVVRGAERAHAARRSAVLGVLAVVSCVVFWSGLPPVLAFGALATAMTARDLAGRLVGGSKVGLALAAVALAGSAVLAFVG